MRAPAPSRPSPVAANSARPTDGGAPAAAEAPRSAPVPLRRARSWFGWLAAAAVFLIALGLCAWNIQLQRSLDDRREELAAQDQALAALARGGQPVAFNVSPQLAGARGAVVRPAQGRPVAVLEGLRRPEGGRLYQLWAVRAGQAIDMGTFLPDDGGVSVIPLDDLTGVDAVAVTVERRREQQPTSEPVLRAALGVSGIPAPSWSWHIQD